MCVNSTSSCPWSTVERMTSQAPGKSTMRSITLAELIPAWTGAVTVTYRLIQGTGRDYITTMRVNLINASPSVIYDPRCGVYSGNGVWSVGDQPSGGAQRSIPPGRYTVTISGNVQIGTWIRCSAVADRALSSPHQIDIQNAIGPDYSGVTEIQPRAWS
jgi:hypothetical protein